MQHIIRPATAIDIPDLVATQLRASEGMTHALYDGTSSVESVGEIVSRRLQAIGSVTSYKNCWVAEAEDNFLASVHAYSMDDMKAEEPDVNIPTSRRKFLEPFDKLDLHAVGSFHVSALSVEPACRRRGIGGRLIEFVCKVALGRNIPTVSLTVFEGNERALLLYKRLKFHEVARQPAVPHAVLTHAGDILMMKRSCS